MPPSSSQLSRPVRRAGAWLSCLLGLGFLATAARADEPAAQLSAPVSPAAVRLDATEVTVAAYGRCLAAGACSDAGLNQSQWGPPSFCNHGSAEKANHPMNCVAQAQAAAYCQWAGGHLPSDDEWERAFGSDPYPWGEARPDSKRLCRSDFDQHGTCPVGSLPGGATASGLLDLAGNVAEWTSTRTCPTCSTFVNRGGAFGGGWGLAVAERFGHLRGRDEETRRGSYLGLRCASGPGVPADAAIPSRGDPALQVDLHVTARDDGTGNEQWSEVFARRVLERASSMAHGDIRFALGSHQRKVDQALYDSKKQSPLLAWASAHAAPGRFTVVISNPRTVGTDGLARTGSGTRDFKPHIVMRSRKQNASEADVYECAAILLHELGHTVGFSHQGAAAQMPYPCDGWWDIPAARERVVTLARWAELHERGGGEAAREAFDCKVGLPVPATSPLFDPPTSAPTAAECAQRCLDWPGCIATAMPTWNNARCFLYGPDASPKGGKGWNNIDVCWKK